MNLVSNYQQNDRLPHVVVIGGGISGLAAAHHLTELSSQNNQKFKLTLLESSDRLGGIISTNNSGDLVLEMGPDSFLTQKPWAMDLCERLNIKDRLIETNKQSRKTYIARGKKVYPLPDGFVMIAPTQWWSFLNSPVFSWSSKMRIALETVIPKANHADESLSSFVTRRFGKEALRQVAQPMIGGIYTADPEKLSLKATMPRFIDLEQKYGSVIRGLLAEQRDNNSGSGARYSMFVSFDKGMQVLVDSLAAKLPKGSVQCNSMVSQVVLEQDAVYKIVLANGSSISADALILALPAHQVSRLINDFDKSLSSDLGAIEYASSVVANLVYDIKDLPSLPNGFGFVVPASENANIIACAFSSVKFLGRAPSEKMIIRVFLGGALQKHIIGLSDTEIEQLIYADLDRFLKIKTNPCSLTISRYPMSMPQYHVGHIERVQQIQSRLPSGFYLAGNAYTGVGIPDCIYSGELAAKAASKYLMDN